MVLDDQIFGMSIVAQYRLELRKKILTSDRVEDDARVLFHLLNCGLLDQEVMDRPRVGVVEQVQVYSIYYSSTLILPSSRGGECC